MRKHLLVCGLAGLLTAGLSASAAAQDNVSGLGADQGAEGTIFIGQTSSTNYRAVRYQCTDATLTSTTISAAVADCCIAGDIYRATVYKGTKQKTFAHTANVGAAAGAAAFAPDVYSANATITTAVKKVDVLATAGNSHPGGLPAGWTLRVITNGGGPTCVQKQLIP